MKIFFANHWLKFLAIAMLLGALTNYFPFVYYQMMNWIAFGAALTTVWQTYKQNNLWFSWFFVLVAVVFNPLAPLYINQNLWRIVDIVGAALFALAIIFVNEPTTKKNSLTK